MLADTLGRRRMLIGCLTWFSVMTGLCAIATSPEVFGVFRFLAGLGLGGVLPTATALSGEYSHPKARNLVFAVIFSGFPVGGIIAALAGIFVIPRFGWQTMFLFGLVPLVLVVPLALKFLPESTPATAASAPGNVSAVKALFSRGYAVATLCFLAASCLCLFMIYGYNTWLPEIMGRAGYSSGSALGFLLMFNLGAVVGQLLISLAADRFGSKPIIVATYLLAGVAVIVLSLRLPTAVLYAAVALGGVGAMGTQTFVLAYVSKYYPVRVGATAMGWALGIGRLGSMLAPPLLGLLIGAGPAIRWNFYALAVPGVIGAALIGLVPRAPRDAAPVGHASADGTVRSVPEPT